MSLLNLGVLSSLLPKSTIDEVQQTMQAVAARALESEARLRRVEQMLAKLTCSNNVIEHTTEEKSNG